MNKQETYQEIQKIWEDARMETRIAESIDRKISPLLPAGWNTSFVIGGWRGYLISRFSDLALDERANLPEEFRYVCKLVELATHKKVERSPWFAEDRLFALMGKCRIPMAEKSGISSHELTIQIRLFETSQCKIAVKETTVKRAELLDDCLAATDAT